MGVSRRISIGGTLMPYDDATKQVMVQRTIADILRAKPGDDQNCMNSICIKAQRNRRIFPHPVYAVSTIKTRVYIVDRLSKSGEFAHAIRYEINKRDSRLIHIHDAQGAGEPGSLVLRIPNDPKGSPKRASNKGKRFSDGAGHGNSPGNPSTGNRDRPVSRGQSARFMVAVGAFNLSDKGVDNA